MGDRTGALNALDGAAPGPSRAAGAAVGLAVLQPILRNLSPDDQPKPTPCADFTCHELAVHLMAAIAQLGAMAGGTGPTPSKGRCRV